MSEPAQPRTSTPIDPEENPWGVPAPSISFDVQPPFTVEGLVTKQEMAQQLDIKTRKPLVWDDGRPRKKVILTMQCKPDQTLADDDGMRQLHVKIPGGLYASINKAVKEAGVRTPVGNHLTVTYTQDEPGTGGKGLSPTKEFDSLISPPDDSMSSESPI